MKNGKLKEKRKKERNTWKNVKSIKKEKESKQIEK